MSEPAAELRGAGLRMGGRDRLLPCSLAVRGGAVTAVVGANGSGKSSLIALLAGEERPTSGLVLLAGRDLAGLADRDRGRMRALLGQETHVSFGFTVEDVVAWGRHPWPGDREEDRSIVEAVIAAQGLAHLRERAVTSLSGGERTRVHLARVLAQRAPLLLLDEADADLDLAGRRMLDDLVRDHARTGGASVVVTHDLARIGHVCDDAVLLHRGAVLASGATGDVLREDLLSEAFEVPVLVRGAGVDLVIRPRD
jgi:iron complex transport system ATP-binding protein